MLREQEAAKHPSKKVVRMRLSPEPKKDPRKVMRSGRARMLNSRLMEGVVWYDRVGTPCGGK